MIELALTIALVAIVVLIHTCIFLDSQLIKKDKEIALLKYNLTGTKHALASARKVIVGREARAEHKRRFEDESI